MSDLIDRQEALDALERSKKTYFDRQVIIGAMKDIVRNLPSAQPERMRGKWIDDGDPLMWECGCCGYRVKRYNNTRYCPNCGAKMEVDDGSD